MCNYCEGNVDYRKDLIPGIYIDGNGKLADDNMLEDAIINFCPMCGRKLIEKEVKPNEHRSNV